MKETLTILRLLAKLLVQLPGKMMKKVRTGRPAAVYGYVNLYRNDDEDEIFKGEENVKQTVTGSRFIYASREEALAYRLDSIFFRNRTWKYWKTKKVCIS